LGHTTESDIADTERTPKNLREVEAEAVALLCCEALGLEGAAYCRGYIQNWLYQILRAGRPPANENANEKREIQMG